MSLDESRRQKLAELVCQISEFFPDYVVLVRPEANKIWWNASDEHWAIGALQRCLDVVMDPAPEGANDLED